MPGKVLANLTAILLCGGAIVMATAQSPQKTDLTAEPTLYVVGYAHLDTEWRWEYPQAIDQYLKKTMRDNFALIEKYPHYIFNFSGSNRYRLMKEYDPEDFARLREYVKEGRWYPAGSSVEEGDVNAPSPESLLRQILYGNEWFRTELGKSSAEYMLPDCFGFPASLPTILAHAGVKGFSTQKLQWGSSAEGGGTESLEDTPEGTPFNVGVWTGPDGESVLAALNPGRYASKITSDLSKPLPAAPPDHALEAAQKQMAQMQGEVAQAWYKHELGQNEVQGFVALRSQIDAVAKADEEAETSRFQGDWAARVMNNGKVTGVFADYRYFGTGDRGEAGRRVGQTPGGDYDRRHGSDSTGELSTVERRAAARVARAAGGPRTGSCGVGDGGSDVSGYYRRAGRAAAAAHGRDGVDQTLGGFAHLAGVSQALAAQGRSAGRRGGEGLGCGGVAGRARVSSRTAERCLDAGTGGAISRSGCRHIDAARL